VADGNASFFGGRWYGGGVGGGDDELGEGRGEGGMRFLERIYLRTPPPSWPEVPVRTSIVVEVSYWARRVVFATSFGTSVQFEQMLFAEMLN
jgi:hypothetical protein